MEIHLDCLSCTLRQALEASRMSTEDTGLQAKIMDEVLALLGRYRSFKNPPAIAREIHRIIKSRTGVIDPYREIKQRDLQVALSLYPALKRSVEGGEDPLYRALKAAAIGNALDSAICVDYDIEQGIEEELEKPLAISDLLLFKEGLATAKTLLVIGDNSGETVFDRLFLEQLPNDLFVTYAVRSAPIINDATMEDARASGLEEQSEIISSGCDSPGILLTECSERFLEVFSNSDLVISKGQGNYETLYDDPVRNRGVYFLLKVKCPVLSDLIDVDLNEYVFKYSGR